MGASRRHSAPLWPYRLFVVLGASLGRNRLPGLSGGFGRDVVEGGEMIVSVRKIELPTGPPEPVPQVKPVLIPMRDLARAAGRGCDAWNISQMEDAIRSIEFFLAKAKAALEDGEPK